MAYFNYRNLDPTEFEALALDVMQRLLGYRLFRYAQGKDGGIDLCDNISEKRIVVQCKKYQQGSYSNLLSVLKNDEKPKLAKMNPRPEKYYVFTSLELLQQQKKEILDLFQVYMEDESFIVDGIAINDFFRKEKNHDLINKNIKLFVSFPENYDQNKYATKSARVLPKCLTTYMPLGPEIGLVGRDKIVDELRRMLDEEGCIALVRGLGGIGKTAVMQKVCDKILTDGNEENHVAWIKCGDSLEDDILALCDAFSISQEAGREQAFKAVIREIKGMAGRLYLFLDDLSRNSVKKDLATLNSLRPNIHVMITSRREIKGIPYKVLKELKEDSAVDMFYGYYERDEERKSLSDVTGIIDSKSVKCHTLLVELLAKAAKQSFGTLGEFRKKLEEEGFFEVYKLNLDIDHYGNTTIEECVKRLYDISGLSDEQKRIMSLFTIFTPEKMIYGKVVEWAGLDGNAVNGLVDRGWLARVEEGFVIHQIVRDSLARQVGDNLKLEEYGELLEEVADTDAYMPRNLEYTKVRERLVLAEDVARNLERRTKRMIDTGEYLKKEKMVLVSSGDLFNNIARVYKDQGDYEITLEYLRKALTIREQVQGTKHRDTAKTYNNMALVYSAQGEYEKALGYYSKALAILERELGIEHPDTATMYNNMALVYRAQGEYKKALEYNGKALAILERELGTEHPDTATTYNNMAELYRLQGDYEKALGYNGKALVILERELGTEHPDIATTYNSMALAYRAQGKYEKALEYYKKDLAINERVLGTGHPSTATTYNNMAGVYDAQGEYEKALEYYGKALSIKEKVLGNEHPSIATTYNNLAGVYHAQGEYEKALEYYKKDLAISERVLGTEHPSTATTYNNMAGVYGAQGEYEKALEYYGKVLVIRERVLGTEHPSTATTYNNMAGVYRAQGEYEKALEYYGKALAIREKVLGTEHPSTATTYNNMAGVYEDQGEYKKALEYYGKALVIKEKILGTEHPSTAMTYNNMAGVYRAQGEYEKARELYEKALTVRMVKLGEDHPYTHDTSQSVMEMERLIELGISEA